MDLQGFKIPTFSTLGNALAYSGRLVQTSIAALYFGGIIGISIDLPKSSRLSYRVGVWNGPFDDITWTD